jgi:hypothetical protein
MSDKYKNDEGVVINLLRKIITSLSCIEKTTTDENFKKEACEYLIDLINQYKKVIESNDVKEIKFKYTEEDLIDFSYRCIENKENDFVKLGEDIQFGIIELTKLLK